jgi:patatin-like phospholipase/acyl hydrolase
VLKLEQQSTWLPRRLGNQNEFCLLVNNSHYGSGTLLIILTDGGGVRGLSTILILKRLMRRYNESAEEADEKHPWEVFDMICGTSTGG